MSEQEQSGQEQSGQEQVRQERDEQPATRRAAAAKARLVFRDPFDQQSRDDTDAGWGERPGTGESGGRGLDWYLSQRPPHHGD
ncbi:hypothetical protein ACGF12_07990 [Kitasatospora sp. NPDC048296]|uniref:hypothetical protein n=1 Tax=Kitasatospora sp. NPDC048296 TaxID=3364048 RepID=UPI00371E8BB8